MILLDERLSVFTDEQIRNTAELFDTSDPRRMLRRFYGRIVRCPKAGCDNWTGAGYPNGYGTFTVKPGYGQMTHRFAWMVNRGPIPARLLVCHRCDNRRCCNPDHLFLGTHKDNTQDGIAKGRIRMKGEDQPTSKLTTEDVLAIRSLLASGMSQTDIARLYNVTNSNIYCIAHRISWKHI